ncbi:glycosyltransferase family 29 protein [Oceanicoccus sagamiensis]|uniref:glycosyltransferase family 29 protein n=1 Tax=Oceanicoccus sagamiensis TaxID=716816 RepID=UPI00146A8AC3|nr:glycosyltransferase family 29 protein [Oceanicoccus sagamiensis]
MIDDRDILKGKRVALVGLAGYLEQKQWGIEIDKADIVVRVNAVAPANEGAQRDLGCRTDWLLTSYNRDIRSDLHRAALEGISNITLCYPDVGDFSQNHQAFSQDLSGRGGVGSVLFQDYERLEVELSCRPSSGLIAIDYLLQSELASLTLYGFSFFSSPHYSGTRKWQSQHDLAMAMKIYKTHIPEKEFNYIKLCFSQDSRLSADPVLMKLLALDTISVLPDKSVNWFSRCLFFLRFWRR